MQVRPAAVAGVAGARQRRADLDPLALGDQHRMAHQVQVDAHGAVVVQDADEVARGIVAAPTLVVLDLHHGAAAGGDDRRALGHGDVHRVAALGVKWLYCHWRPGTGGTARRARAADSDRAAAAGAGRRAHSAASACSSSACRPCAAPGSPGAPGCAPGPPSESARRAPRRHCAGCGSATRPRPARRGRCAPAGSRHPRASSSPASLPVPGARPSGRGRRTPAPRPRRGRSRSPRHWRRCTVDGQGRSRSCRGEQATEKEKAP